MRQTILFLQPRLEVLFNTYLSNPLVESRKLRAQYILGDLILTSSDTYSPDCIGYLRRKTTALSGSFVSIDRVSLLFVTILW